MNKLFNKGDYVLLSDCEVFDTKYGLAEDTTMWDVASKMKGGVPDENYMLELVNDVCVGLLEDEIGCWEDLPKENYSTRLSVEDVLYRSEDGLTLDELSKIQGAFDDGKEYECLSELVSNFTKGKIYPCAGKGLINNNGDIIKSGYRSKFKPVTPKTEWVPKVGEDVMTPWGKAKVELIHVNDICLSNEYGLGVEKITELKPIDKEREATIKKCNSIWRDKNNGVSGSAALQLIETLYDAGMLNRGNE